MRCLWASITSNANGYQARIGAGKTADVLQLDPALRITSYTPNAGLQKAYAILPTFQDSPQGWRPGKLVYWPASAGKKAAKGSMETVFQYQQVGNWTIPAFLAMKTPDNGGLNITLTQCALD